MALGTLFLSNTPALFIDSQATNFNGRYYRAVNQPLRHAP